MTVVVPPGYLPLSAAVKRLEQGMWGGVDTPVPARKLKKQQPRLSVGHEIHRRPAAERLREAAVAGELTVFILPDVHYRDLDPADEVVRWQCAWPAAELIVPPEVIAQLCTIRGGLPDHPIRPRLFLGAGLESQRLQLALTNGTLVFRECNFATWYRKEREAARWPSQREKKTRRRGRPSKQNGIWPAAIIGLVHTGDWSAAEGIPELRKLLSERFGERPPSTDTLRRLVCRLHGESLDDRLRLARNHPRAEKSQNSLGGRT